MFHLEQTHKLKAQSFLLLQLKSRSSNRGGCLPSNSNMIMEECRTPSSLFKKPIVCFIMRC